MKKDLYSVLIAGDGCTSTVLGSMGRSSGGIVAQLTEMFRSFKSAWNEEIRKFIHAAAGHKLQNREFFHVFNPAFQ